MRQPMSGRVLVVGLERPLYLKIEPILSRSALNATACPRGTAACFSPATLCST